MFLIARRQVDVGGVNQELMYMSLKFINNIWVLVEVKVATGSTSVGVSIMYYTASIYHSFSVACSEDVCCGCDTWSPGGFQLHPARLGYYKRPFRLQLYKLRIINEARYINDARLASLVMPCAWRTK